MTNAVTAAIRHGYSYRYVISPGIPAGDRYVTWAKVRQEPRRAQDKYMCVESCLRVTWSRTVDQDRQSRLDLIMEPLRLCAQVPQMYALLKEFRYIIVIDPDAYFAKPEVPVHLLMGRWGWQPHSRCCAMELSNTQRQCFCGV